MGRKIKRGVGRFGREDYQPWGLHNPCTYLVFSENMNSLALSHGLQRLILGGSCYYQHS